MKPSRLPNKHFSLEEFMSKEWYVVHTYTGYEMKAKQNLEDRVKQLGKEDLFGEILVPTENIVELVKGKKKESKRKFFPGLHPRQHGAERRDLVHREEHTQDHRIRRWRHDPSSHSGGRGQDGSPSRLPRAPSSRNQKRISKRERASGSSTAPLPASTAPWKRSGLKKESCGFRSASSEGRHPWNWTSHKWKKAKGR